MDNINMNYLDDKYGHMNANILYQLKSDLNSMDLEAIKNEVKFHNYPIDNYEELTKEDLISEIVIWNADNDIPVEADELEAILNDDIEFLNQEQHNYEEKENLT